MRLPYLLCAALVVGLPTVASAGPIVFNDGAAHDVSTVLTDGVVVGGAGTSVRFLAGSDVTPSTVLQGVAIGTALDLSVEGGTIRGASGFSGPPNEIGDAIQSFGGDVMVSGGSVTGGEHLVGGNPGTGVEQGRHGITQHVGSLAISGGVISGGASGDGAVAYGGHAIAGGDTTINISGGTLTGGAFRGTNGHAGYAIFGYDTVGTISGGTFTAGTGGPLTRTLGIQAGSMFILTGGLFQTGSQFELASNSFLDVYGTGLTHTSGRLMGTLADGSPIDVVTSVHAGSEIRLHTTVPEPSGVALFALGAIGMIARRRRSRV